TTDPGATRRAAWASFYSRFGFRQERNASFVISPLASEPLTFQIKPRNRPAIRVGTYRRGTGRRIDVGSLRVTPGATLKVILLQQSKAYAANDVFDVEARLARPDPGTGAPAEPMRGQLSTRSPLTLHNMPLGGWALSLTRDGLLLGRESVLVLADNPAFSWR